MLAKLKTVLCAFSAICLALSSCAHWSNTEPAQVDVTEPAQRIEGRVDSVDAHARDIDDSTDVIDAEVATPALQAELPDVSATLNSELAEIDKATDGIQSDTERVRLTAGTLAGLQPNIDSLAQDRAELRKRIDELESGLAKRRQRWFLWLQIAGLIAVAGGVAVGVMMRSPGIAVPIVAGGATITMAARVWQDYAWLLSLVAAGLVLAGIGYLAYLAVTDRKELISWWEQYGKSS